MFLGFLQSRTLHLGSQSHRPSEIPKISKHADFAATLPLCNEKRDFSGFFSFSGCKTLYKANSRPSENLGYYSLTPT